MSFKLVFSVLFISIICQKPKTEDTTEYTEEGYESIVNKIMIYVNIKKNRQVILKLRKSLSNRDKLKMVFYLIIFLKKLVMKLKN